jgi:hypothetical protein
MKLYTVNDKMAQNRLLNFLILMVFLVFAFGCVSQSAPNPLPNITSTGSSEWSMYSGIGMSFEFPSKMALTQNTQSYNLGKGTASVSGEESGSSLLLVIYMNSSIYGLTNSDGTGAAYAFLENDMFSDVAGMLNKAAKTGNVSNYTIANGSAYASEMPFTMEVLTSGGKTFFEGFAIDIYNPSQSALYRVRILAEDEGNALRIKERFVKSFKG